MTPRDRSILTKVHRRVKEALPAGDVLVPEPFITPNYSDVWVQITSTSQTDGRYPGTVYMRNVDATFTLLGTAGDSWVDTPNGESLSTGVYYRAVAVGIKVADNKPIFDVLVGGGSASYCIATRSTTATIPTGTITPTGITLDTTITNSGNASLVSEAGLNGVIKVTSSSGRFRATGDTILSANSTGDRTIHIWVYDDDPTVVDVFQAYFRAPAAMAASMSLTADFVSPGTTFYVRLLLMQSSGGDLTTTAETSSYRGSSLAVQEIL